MTDRLRLERIRWQDERRIADHNLQAALDKVDELRELAKRQQAEIVRLQRLLTRELQRSDRTGF